MGSVFASDRVFSVVDHLVAIFPFPEQREGTFTRMKVLDFTSHTIYYPYQQQLFSVIITSNVAKIMRENQ